MRKLVLISLLAPSLFAFASPHEYDDDWYEYHHYRKYHPYHKYGYRASPDYYMERDLRAMLQNKEAMKKMIQNNPDLRKQLEELLK